MSGLSQARSVVELAQALISLPSINPEQASPAERESGLYGEERLAHALTDFFQDIGYEVELEEVEPGRPNFRAQAANSSDKRRLLLGPHLDTVRIDQMTIDPFAAGISEGKLWGRGASDTKGPMAAMMWGLKEQRARLADLPVAVDFVGFMGEETQQLGSKYFAKHYASQYEFALVGEPTSLQIVNRTKGCLWTTLSAPGVSGHASQPERGENALWALFEGLQELKEGLEEAFLAHHDAVLGAPTMNLGTAQGGTSPNIVPDWAEASLDLRSTPSLWRAGGAEALIKRILKERNLSLRVEDLMENPPMEVADAHPWIRALQRAHPDSRCVGAPWFSDAAHLNAGGIASVCLGPGSIAQAHTKDEFIMLDDLEAGARYFSEFIASLAEW